MEDEQNYIKELSIEITKLMKKYSEKGLNVAEFSGILLTHGLMVAIEHCPSNKEFVHWLGDTFCESFHIMDEYDDRIDEQEEK